MTNALNKFKLILKKLWYFFPSPLPVGVTEFNGWADDILTTYGWPQNDSMRFALATMVINQASTKAYRSKFYFNLVCHAAASKEIAGNVFYTLKMKQRAEVEAAKQAEATALSVVSNDAAQQ